MKKQKKCLIIISDKTIDALGKMYPIPVILTKKEFKKIRSGEIIELIVDDRGALADIPALQGKLVMIK